MVGRIAMKIGMMMHFDRLKPSDGQKFAWLIQTNLANNDGEFRD